MHPKLGATTLLYLYIIVGKVAKKSILESFKEELKRTQRERTDRHTFSNAPATDCMSTDAPGSPSIATELEVKNEATELLFDLSECGDSISTNLYVGKYPNGSLMQTLGIMNNIVMCLYEYYLCVCVNIRLTVANSCNI